MASFPNFSFSYLVRNSLYAGLFAGIVFILIQSAFDMGSITSRHAGSYINNEHITPTLAIVLAWTLHLIVSIIYASLSILVFTLNRNWLVSVFQILMLGWLTTLIATPANAFMMIWISTAKLPLLSTLPGLNMHLDAKLLLHIVFYILVLMPMYVFTTDTKQ